LDCGLLSENTYLFILIVHNVKINSKLIITMSQVVPSSMEVAESTPSPPKLENVFNRMYLLTTNVLPDGFINPSQEEIVGWAGNLDDIDEYIKSNFISPASPAPIPSLTISHLKHLKEAYKKRLNSYDSYNNSDDAKLKCINYDLSSLNSTLGIPNEEDAISEIAILFYSFALRIHFYSLYCILELKRELPAKDIAAGIFPDPVGGVLFQNPFFTAYDTTFHGPDGIHDAEPRGDMVGKTVVKKKRVPAHPKAVGKL